MSVLCTKENCPLQCDQVQDYVIKEFKYLSVEICKHFHYRREREVLWIVYKLSTLHQLFPYGWNQKHDSNYFEKGRTMSVPTRSAVEAKPVESTTPSQTPPNANNNESKET